MKLSLCILVAVFVLAGRGHADDIVIKPGQNIAEVARLATHHEASELAERVGHGRQDRDRVVIAVNGGLGIVPLELAFECPVVRKAE